MFKKGFTLIELLIVVLIIAILAAIAVPNFLEFQTRAKVSRAKADMRSVATALEAYFVDNDTVFNDYNDGAAPPPPRIVWPNSIQDEVPGTSIDLIDPSTATPPGRTRNRTYAHWVRLTTPIAYMSTAPIDAFSRALPLHYESFVSGGRIAFAVFQSAGPDLVMGSVNNFDPGGGTSGQGAQSTAKTVCTHNPYYDPTNGTVSCGELYRFAAIRNINFLGTRLGPYLAGMNQ